MKIQLTKEDQAIIKDFAIKCVKTNYKHYASTRNQDNYKKIAHDIEIGKLAEQAVYLFLSTHYNMKLNPPDLKIYPKNKKEHGADLSTDINIKSCRFGGLLSWVYQPNTHYLYTGKHIFCVVNKDTVEIKYIIKGENLKGLYSDPLEPKLWGKKKCIYNYDLKTLDDNEFEYKGDIR